MQCIALDARRLSETVNFLGQRPNLETDGKS
jgi:hypothetical protein